MKERFGKATENGKLFGTTMQAREQQLKLKKREDGVSPETPCNTREKAMERKDSNQTRYIYRRKGATADEIKLIGLGVKGRHNPKDTARLTSYKTSLLGVQEKWHLSL